MSITSWSISRWHVYDKCPYRARLQWVDKVPDTQPKPAADRGTQIHTEAEEYVIGKGQLTHNLRHFETPFASLRRGHTEGLVICEEEWGFDKEWRPCDWRAAWLRLKCDAVYHVDKTHLAVIDFKTGKRFGNELKHAEQLQLYAVCALIRYPDVEQVTCELWYLDVDDMASFTMRRRQLLKYLKEFDRKGRSVTEDTVFEPKPNIHNCKYCPYAPDRQAVCPHGVNQQGRKIEKPIEFVNKPSKTDALFDEDELKDSLR